MHMQTPCDRKGAGFLALTNGKLLPPIVGWVAERNPPRNLLTENCSNQSGEKEGVGLQMSRTIADRLGEAF